MTVQTSTGRAGEAEIDRPTTGGMGSYLLSAADDDHVALIDGDTAITYGRLRGAVATIAARLHEAHLPAGSPVALLAPNGLLWVAAYIATMDAGMVTVPLPVTLSVSEAEARLRWVGARAAVVAASPGRALGAELAEQIPVIDESILDAAPLAWEQRPLVARSDDDDAAYLFTSGTTGDPRAVRLTRENLQANTESILGYLKLGADDRALVVLPFTYVFGASLLHTHLRVGATLVLQRSVAYPESTVRMLRDRQCTVFAGVPSVFHTLLRNSTFGRQALPHLRLVQQAGGRLPPALLRELAAAQPQARVFVMYGQTEATARLSALDPEQVLARPGSVGRGIPGVDLRVLGREGLPVAVGEVGEIHATGPNISPGYLHDPAETERKMPGGVLRTGDLATVDEDGYIYIVDRAEDFIKTWGYRVASTDVEAAAMECAELIAAAAVGVADDAAGERVELVAVARPGAAVTAEEVLRTCRAFLPKHAVPARVRFAGALPVNANGKVLKREVRAMLSADEGADHGRCR